MKKIAFIFIFLVTVIPAAAFAQQTNVTSSCSDPITNISGVFNLAGCIIAGALIPLLVTLSVVVFIVGIIKYIAGADEAAKRQEGRNFMIYGIVALFVLVSIWGLVGVIQGTFGLPTIPLIPQLQVQ